jgi:haloalkane dehalogenase
VALEGQAPFIRTVEESIMQRRDFISAAAGVTAGVVAGGTGGYLVRRAGAPVPAVGGSVIDVTTFHAMRRFARTPFGRIAYVERGEGPVALFIHGLPLNGYQWRGALERLSSVRRCIAPDSMGLGYSEIPEGQDVSPEAQVRMFAAFLDTLEIPAVDLIASDSGGAIAQVFVARYPERVRSLLLTNCDVHEDSPPPAILPQIAAAKAGTFADAVLLPHLLDKSTARRPDGLGGCCYTRPAEFADETIECYLRPLLSTPLRKAQFHAYFAALEQNPLLPIEPILRRSPVPVRVVWGMGDILFAPSGPEELARIFPQWRGVRRVEGARLFFPEEFPDIIAEEAQRLWAGA